MLTAMTPAPRRLRTSLVLGAVGVTVLLIAALPELTAAGVWGRPPGLYRAV